MRLAAEAPAVLLSPHLDDAVLSAWSVLRRSAPLRVIDVFAGIPEPGFVTRYDRVAGATESARLVRERLAEDREALALAGREPIALDFLDDQYRGGELDREAVTAAIEAAAPAASALFLPAGLGGHPDHVATREIGRSLAAEQLPLFLYAELPYAVRYGWPHWVTGAERDPHLDPDAEWNHYLESAVERGESLRPEPLRLSDPECERKLTAMRTYRTQFPSLNAGVVDRLANPSVRCHEVRWRVVSGAVD